MAIAALPSTHTAAAHTRSLEDDDCDSLVMSRTFSFHGTSYDTLHIGSNGYVTFGAASTERQSDLATFLQAPRVAAMMRDLDPTAGGTIMAEEFADRAVVAFEAVPEYDSPATNTFQIEFFFDTGVIRVSYLGLGTES